MGTQNNATKEGILCAVDKILDIENLKDAHIIIKAKAEELTTINATITVLAIPTYAKGE